MKIINGGDETRIVCNVTMEGSWRHGSRLFESQMDAPLLQVP